MNRSFSTKKMQAKCGEVCLILKALSHPRRLMILGHLIGGSKSVSDLVELCEISQSQMSQFLTRMGYEGLVRAERQGRFQSYSIADPRLVTLLTTIQKEYCHP